MVRKVWLSIIIGMSVLSGCSSLEEEPAGKDVEVSLGLTPDFSYPYEEQRPNILVNQLGYSLAGEKTALLEGDNLDSEYVLYDADTEKIVFSGKLTEPTAGKNTGEKRENSLHVADFSELRERGWYYLFHRDLGYSYPFFIGENPDRKLEEYLLKQLGEKTEDTASLAYQLAGILLTLELYEEKIELKEEIELVLQEKITRLAQAQDPKTGAVYANIPEESSLELTEKTERKKDEEERQADSAEAAAQYAGVMAMYATYRLEKDWKEARQYQKMAEKAFLQIQNRLDEVSTDAGYFATAQLYKKTLHTIYVPVLKQYLSEDKMKNLSGEYDFTLFADYAYLTIRWGADLEWSRQVMNKIMEQAEEIAFTSQKETYYISSQRASDDLDGILKDASIMAFVNYVITNYEYSGLLKNYLAYFLGKNPNAQCLIEGIENKNQSAALWPAIEQDNLGILYLLFQSAKGNSSV